jgi:hypothetical protein
MQERFRHSVANVRYSRALCGDAITHIFFGLDNLQCPSGRFVPSLAFDALRARRDDREAYVCCGT